MGDLRKLQRLVRRHQLKDRIRLLNEIITTHLPLVKAMDITERARLNGVAEGRATGYNEGFRACLETLKKTEEGAPVVASHEATPTQS